MSHRDDNSRKRWAGIQRRIYRCIDLPAGKGIEQYILQPIAIFVKGTYFRYLQGRAVLSYWQGLIKSSHRITDTLYVRIYLMRSQRLHTAFCGLCNARQTAPDYVLASHIPQVNRRSDRMLRWRSYFIHYLAPRLT